MNGPFGGWVDVLTLGGALGCGLVAGVFFAFSTFVMPALARLSPAQGIAAMNSINVAAITPTFMVALFGTGAACAVLAGMSLVAPSRPAAGLVLAGSLLYLAGSVVVTLVCNVPRNDALAVVDAASADGATLWASYLAGWTAWNHVRTVTAMAAAALLTNALCLSRSGGNP